MFKFVCEICSNVQVSENTIMQRQRICLGLLKKILGLSIMAGWNSMQLSLIFTGRATVTLKSKFKIAQ